MHAHARYSLLNVNLESSTKCLFHAALLDLIDLKLIIGWIYLPTTNSHQWGLLPLFTKGRSRLIFQCWVGGSIVWRSRPETRPRYFRKCWTMACGPMWWCLFGKFWGDYPQFAPLFCWMFFCSEKTRLKTWWKQGDHLFNSFWLHDSAYKCPMVFGCSRDLIGFQRCFPHKPNEGRTKKPFIEDQRQNKDSVSTGLKISFKIAVKIIQWVETTN